MGKGSPSGGKGKEKPWVITHPEGEGLGELFSSPGGEKTRGGCARGKKEENRLCRGKKGNDPERRPCKKNAQTQEKSNRGETGSPRLRKKGKERSLLTAEEGKERLKMNPRRRETATTRGKKRGKKAFRPKKGKGTLRKGKTKEDAASQIRGRSSKKKGGRPWKETPIPYFCTKSGEKKRQLIYHAS